MTREERENLEGLAGVTASLDQPATSDSATVLGDLVGADGRDWVGEVEQELVDERLRDAVDKLPELQREVLSKRFGLDGSTPASLQATADALGIGVRRVRRAEAEGLAALQATTASSPSTQRSKRAPARHRRPAPPEDLEVGWPRSAWT